MYKGFLPLRDHQPTAPHAHLDQLAPQKHSRPRPNSALADEHVLLSRQPPKYDQRRV